jgi:hypothetical protein
MTTPRRIRIAHRIRIAARVAVLDQWGPQQKRLLLDTTKDMMKRVREKPHFHPNPKWLPDHVLALWKRPEVRNQVLALLPPGAQYYNFGVDALVFVSPDKQHVYKLTMFPQTRDRSRDPQELLQPIWVKEIVPQKLWLAHYKKARTTADPDLTPEERQRIEDFTDSGLKHWPQPPVDWGSHQVGIVDNQMKVLDEESVPEEYYRQ